MLKRILAVTGLVLSIVSGITYLALESGDVVTVETLDSSTDEIRVTRIWFVRSDGGLFLEAGTPTNSWVEDLEHASTIKLAGHNLDGEYAFKIHLKPADHENIRALMRSKYGWRDLWIAILFDTSQSQLVEVIQLRCPNCQLKCNSAS